MKTNSSKIQFIYWFAFYSLDSPSVRYRGKYPLEFLQKANGISSELVIPSYSVQRIFRFLKCYFSALIFPKKNSIIIIQRVSSNFIYSTLLKLLVKTRKHRCFYDIDDADYLENYSKTYFYFLKNCNCVIVGSNELAKNLSKYNSNIVVNTSPTPDLGIFKEGKNSPLTLGWIGCFGGGHKASLLRDFFPAVRDLPIKIKLIFLGVNRAEEVEFLHGFFKNEENIELEIPSEIDWKNEKEVQQRIARFDVGIATLIDDEFHRSKSAFKVKQYLNNGVPVLSSDVAENNVFINEGKNGFLCKRSADFKRKILEFEEMSEEKYASFQENARKSIGEFNIEKYCSVLISYLSK